jgi:psiF repeat
LQQVWWRKSIAALPPWPPAPLALCSAARRSRVGITFIQEIVMKLAAAAFLATLCAFGMSPGHAAEKAAAKEMTPQQQKMVDCNKKAEGKKGDDRKAFMSQCLKADSAAKPAVASKPAPKPAPAAKAAPAAAKPAPSAAQLAQQEKMKTCNADATTKGLTGDARKSFMSTCLKGDTSGAAAH